MDLGHVIFKVCGSKPANNIFGATNIMSNIIFNDRTSKNIPSETIHEHNHLRRLNRSIRIYRKVGLIFSKENIVYSRQKLSPTFSNLSTKTRI